MRKLLNTLYVTTSNAYLTKDGTNVVASVEGAEMFRIPIMNIEAVVSFSYMGASPGLMKLCADNGVALTFMTPQGRFISRVQGPVKGNVLLRMRQYELAKEQESCLRLSSIMIAGKIQNSRAILKRYQRDYGNDAEVERVTEVLLRKKSASLKASDLDQLRGVEGDAANAYFSVFSNLIVQQRADFPFDGRNRRPPKDAVNAMLSFTYTLLANDIAAALETVGLDPYVGFLHTLRPGRTSLALDLEEELRAYLCDRLVLSMINLKQVSRDDFLMQGDQGVILTDSARKTLLSTWQSRKKEQIMHPYLKEKIPIGLIPYAQAILLARFIRGDIDDYPVFLIT